MRNKTKPHKNDHEKGLDIKKPEKKVMFKLSKKRKKMV